MREISLLRSCCDKHYIGEISESTAFKTEQNYFVLWQVEGFACCSRDGKRKNSKNVRMGGKGG